MKCEHCDRDVNKLYKLTEEICGGNGNYCEDCVQYYAVEETCARCGATLDGLYSYKNFTLCYECYLKELEVIEGE